MEPLCPLMISTLGFLILTIPAAKPHDSLDKQMQFQGGTIVALLRENHRFIIASDSRRSTTDGSKYWDDSCKIAILDERTIFVGAGRTKAFDRSGNVVLDSARFAKDAFSHVTVSKEPDKLRTLVDLWGQSISAAVQRAVTVDGPGHVFRGLEHGVFVRGVFVSTRDDPEFVVKMVRVLVPPAFNQGAEVEYRVDDLDIDVGEPVSFGIPEAQIAIDLLNRYRAEYRYGDPDEDISVFRVKEAMNESILAVKKKYQAGGPVDIIALPAGGKAKWVSRKAECKD